MKHVTLHVAHMRCRRCVREVTARLRDVAGVETVAADSRTARVRLDGDLVLADVLRALAGTTYRPEVVETGHVRGADGLDPDAADHLCVHGPHPDG